MIQRTWRHVARATNGAVEAHVLPDLTHALRPDFLPPSLFRYGELLKQLIDFRLLELIASWPQRQVSGIRG